MLSIDETIAKEKANAEKLRKIIETGYEGEISIEALFCDDTSAIKEVYERFENCAEEQEQLAEWLEELKAIKEMDLSIPQHFTKEQSVWIKAYCIRKNIEFYNKALDDFVKFANTMPTVETEDGEIRPMRLEEMAEKLKAGGENND